MVAAIVQWLGIGERIFHGIWQWHKFSGYSNDGSTSISYFMAAFTILASLALIFLGVLVRRYSEERLVSKLASVSVSALSIGIVGLAILLASPVGILVSR